MIKSLHIKNVQSHKDSFLEFDPGVNIILGSTDSGKSAILRSLDLVIFNRPQGDAYRSNWGGDTSVTLVTGEGDSIQRIRTKSKNAYKINSDDDLEAVKSYVPEEVRSLLRLNENNVQRQADPPFLISSTAGEVSAHFNKVANLSQISKAISVVESMVRSCTQDISYKKNEIDEQKIDLAKYNYLQKMEVDIEVLEMMESQIITKNNQSSKLSSLLKAIAKVETEILQTSTILSLESTVDACISIIDDVEDLEAKANDLKCILDDLHKVDVKISLGISLQSLQDKVFEVEQLSIDRDNVRDQKHNLEDLLEEIQTIEQNILSSSKQLQRLENTYASNMPDVCPLCDSPLKHEHGTNKES